MTRATTSLRSAAVLAVLCLSPAVRADETSREPHPTIRLRIEGSTVYGTEREVEIKEALIFDTLSVFIGSAKGAGGVGRARVGTYAVFVYLSNQERGCGRLQEVVPSLQPPKKRAAEFARRIAPEKPAPNAPFVPFDVSDPAAFDLQLQAIDYLDHPQLAPYEGKEPPHLWSLFAYAAYLSGPIPEVKLLHGNGNRSLPSCPDPAKGWLPTVAAADFDKCSVLPLRFTKAQRKAARWQPVPTTAPVQGAFLELWQIFPPSQERNSTAPPGGGLEDGYRVVASIDAKEWSLHADVPAKRCPGLRHVHVELE